MKNYLLGIDIGTSGLKVAAVDREGNVVGQASAPYAVRYKGARIAEQNVGDWWKALKLALKRLGASVDLTDVEAIGVAGQSWSMIPIDRQGKVLSENPIWQDNRSLEIVERIKRELGDEEIFRLCGNPLSPSYTTGKILWLKENRQDAYKDTYKILQSNGYIVYRLTGRACLDVSQGYGLHNFDIERKTYDAAMSQKLGIDLEKLPDILGCDEVAGMVTKAAAMETGLCEGTKVVAGGLDAACAALGVGVTEDFEAQEQGGQAGGMSVCLSSPVRDRRLILSPHVVPGKWLLQGGTVGGGGALKWFEREFAFEERTLANLRGGSSFSQLSDLAEKVAAGSDGMIFLPYLQGERSPIWDVNAKGAYYGIDYQKTKAHFVRSTMEGVAYSLLHNLEIARQAGAEVSILRAMGGSANSEVWTQIKCDVTEKEILVPGSDSATALGACFLAGVGSGYYKGYGEAISRAVHIRRRHVPDKKKGEVYRALYRKYLKLYENTKELNET